MNPSNGIIALLLALLGGLAYYFKSKADKSTDANVQSATKIADAPLAQKQDDDAAQIAAMTKQIADMLIQHQQAPKDQTPEERAKSWEQK